MTYIRQRRTLFPVQGGANGAFLLHSLSNTLSIPFVIANALCRRSRWIVEAPVEKPTVVYTCEWHGPCPRFFTLDQAGPEVAPLWFIKNNGTRPLCKTTVRSWNQRLHSTRLLSTVLCTSFSSQLVSFWFCKLNQLQLVDHQNLIQKRRKDSMWRYWLDFD